MNTTQKIRSLRLHIDGLLVNQEDTFSRELAIASCKLPSESEPALKVMG